MSGARCLRDHLPAAIAVALLFLPVATYANTVCPHVWSTNLRLGSTGADVHALQQFLNTDPATMVAASGDGSSGLETNRFGALTNAAVVRFQEKYATDILVPNGLTKGTGLVGVSTRAKLNALCVAPLTSSPAQSAAAAAPSSAPQLVITQADQTAQTLAPAGALYVPFTNLTLTAQGGDVTVSSITVQRSGPASDQAFADIDLFDNDGYLAIAYFGANHAATFRTSLTIPAGTSQTISIVGDMAADVSSYSGQMASMTVTGIAANAPLAGALPATGTLQTINDTLVIGIPGAALSSYDPGTDRNIYINDTDVRFSGIQITADSAEAERVNSIAWEQNGSAGGTDLANVHVVANGVSYPTDSDGKYYTATFPGGITIEKGNSLDVYIAGDVLPGAVNRTIKFDIYQPGDVDITGLTYGYGLYLVPAGNTATSGNSVFLTDDGDTDGVILYPFFSGASATVNGASVTSIGK